MADAEHLHRFLSIKNEIDIQNWNRWRKENNGIRIDLSGEDLSGRDISFIDLTNADLRRTFYSHQNQKGQRGREANFSKSDLEGANFSYSDLSGSYFKGSKMIGTDFTEAILRSALFLEATLTNAKLNGSNLRYARFVESDLTRANLSNSEIYAVSAWNVKLEETKQINLVLTKEEPTITVDDLQVAQFIHLLLNRSNLRNVLDTVTSKAVLILGRFTPERKAVLDAMAIELRKYNLLPIIFDFERPASRDFTETIRILAGISYFVIADLTNPSSVPLELQALVPDYYIPFVPVLQKGKKTSILIQDLRKYPWMLETVLYLNKEHLVQIFKERIIDKAHNKSHELKK